MSAEHGQGTSRNDDTLPLIKKVPPSIKPDSSMRRPRYIPRFSGAHHMISTPTICSGSSRFSRDDSTLRSA